MNSTSNFCKKNTSLNKSVEIFFKCFFLILVAVFCSSVRAADRTVTDANVKEGTHANSALEIDLKQFTVIQQGKQESLEEATTIKPGDVVEYQAAYHNRDKSPLAGVAATLPIPVGMEYVPLSDKTNRPSLAATENGKYEAVPLMRKIKTKDGQIKMEEIPLSEYRAVRWLLGTLESGKEVKISMRAKVSAN